MRIENEGAGDARVVAPTSMGQRVVNVLLAVILVVGAGVFFWGADRGFDFSDEGVYLLDFQNPAASQTGFTFYQYVGAGLYRIVAQTIPALRIAGFVLLAAATAFFWWRLLVFLRQSGLSVWASRGEETGFFLVVMVSVLPAFCWPPPTPSYNTFAGFGLLVAAGCFLSAMRVAGGVLWQVGALVGFGVAMVLLLLVKGSSAVGLGLFCVGLLVVWPLMGVRRKLGLLGLLAGLTFAAAAVALICIPALRGIVDFLGYSLSSLAQGGGASGIIGRHASEAWDLIYRTQKSYLLPLIVSVLGVVLIQVVRRRFIVAWEPVLCGGVVALSIGCVFVAGLSKNAFFAGIEHRNGSMLAYFALFLVLAILALGLPRAAGGSSKRERFASWLIVLWLAALPFIGAAGTTHRIYVNALLHLAPLFASILILSGMIDRRLRWGLAGPMAGGLIGVLALAQFFSGYVVQPYRLPTSKGEQSVPVEIGKPESVLKLDPASASFVEEIRGLCESAGFRSGGDVLGLFDLPGVVFAVGGVSPGRPWYFSNYGEVGENDNIRAIEAAGAGRLRKSLIIQADNDPRVATYLARVGIQFPDEYRFIGEVWHPFREYSLRVWAPAGTPQKE